MGFCQYPTIAALGVSSLIPLSVGVPTIPQLQLPLFPMGGTPITTLLAFGVENGRVTYFNGSLPVFLHDEKDLALFRMITAQFCLAGHAKQAEIARALGIPLVTVKVYRSEVTRFIN